MGSSLKDALLKAGLKSTKTENERPKQPKKEKKKTQIHQEQRTFCEVCSKTMPDVERYIHRNASLDAQWMCCECADYNKIPDETRVSAQSDFSKRRLFRRQFGKTLKVDKDGNLIKSTGDDRGQSKRRHPGRNGHS